MRAIRLTVLLAAGLMLTGCCIWNCYDGDPDPIAPLPTPSKPLQTANNVLTRLLAGPFVDETQTVNVAFDPQSWKDPALSQVRYHLHRRLAAQPHVTIVPSVKSADFVLSGDGRKRPEDIVAAFVLWDRPKAEPVWSYDEKLDAGGGL